MPARRQNALKILLKNKIGVTGLAIILFFTFLAVFAPFITSNDPNQVFVANPWAIPQWATIFPPYQGWPTNMQLVSSDITSWNNVIIYHSHVTISTGIASIPNSILAVSRYSSSEISNKFLEINVTLPATDIPENIAVLNSSTTFTYNFKPPYNFLFGLFVYPLEVKNVTDFYFLITLKTPSGKVYHLTNYLIMATSVQEVISYRNGLSLNHWNPVSLTTILPDVNVAALGSGGEGIPNTGLIYLNETGTYTYTIQLDAITSSSVGFLSLRISNPYLFVLGRAYGLMGTDFEGRDIWSQFVYGARISMEVGILAGVFSVLVGAFLGLFAGFVEGILSEVTMRITDIFLVIPFLPLAIVFITVISQNAFLAQTIYFWLIVLFVIFGWPGVTRVIRSQVLSLKQRGYIEAAKVLGAKGRYIIRRHLLPGVMGLVYANIALSVPGFILTEAALDFLFPGVSETPTWGRMLSEAFEHAAAAAYYDYAWWWFIFPGLAIVIVSLSFIMLGYALDEIFNPRLRGR